MRLIILALIMSLVPFQAMSLTREELQQKVVQLEEKHNIPEGLFNSIVLVESNYNIEAINPKIKKGTAIDSFGLTQLTEDTAKHHCGLTKAEIYNPIKNLNCGAKVLKYQLERFKTFKNKISYAASAYNDGTPCVCDGKVYKWPVYDNRICRMPRSKTPKVCSPNQKGRFWNQDYVNKVNKNLPRKES